MILHTSAAILPFLALALAPQQPLFGVRLQSNTPGTQQVGHSNISGTSISGTFQGSGSALTNLNATQVASGTLADARLSGNVALLPGSQTFSGQKTFSAAPSFTSSPGAPFAVTSTTKVTNLNADRLDGLDSSAFLQALPNPLGVINGTAGFYAIRGETTASNGVGTIGISTNTSTFGIGVAAASVNGPGMRANSYGGNFPGVEAYSNFHTGVLGFGAVNGVEGQTSNPFTSGVYGQNNDSGTSGFGVAGRGGTGLYGESTTSGYALLASGDAWITGDLLVSGAKFGFVVDIVKNGDGSPLEPGDLVEIIGSEPSVLGDIPVIVVRKASAERAGAVLGPIANALEVQPSQLLRPLASDELGAALHASAAARAIHLMDIRRIAGAIAPGDYGNVVTLGSFRTIKVDGSYGPIQAGDALVASPNPGHAMADANPRTGTVIGKALADWNGGAGEIPVMVSSR